MDARTELPAVELGRSPDVSPMPVAASGGAVSTAYSFQRGESVMPRFGHRPSSQRQRAVDCPQVKLDGARPPSATASPRRNFRVGSVIQIFPMLVRLRVTQTLPELHFRAVAVDCVGITVEAGIVLSAAELRA